MSLPQIIIPDPRGGDREQQLKAYFEHRNLARYGEFKSTDVKFQHDPEWREHWLSITAARERRGIWLFVSWVFWLAQVSFIGGYYYGLRR